MSTKAQRRDWSAMVAWGLAITLILGGFALIVLIFGGVTREEFSPQTFQRRESTYFRIPIVQLQVTPVLRKSTTNSLENHLITKSLVKPTSGTGTVHWDLVSLRGISPRAEFGDAAILCRYLDALEANGDLAWRKWSVDNPELSAALWPLVAFAARERVYQAVPDMLHAAQKHAAQKHTVAAELDAELRTKLARRLSDMGRYHAAHGEVTEAEAARLSGQRIQTMKIGASTDDPPPTADG